MVGGTEAALARARPVLELMGATIALIGSRNGDDQAARVANQIIVGLTVEAAASPILEYRGARLMERNFAPGFRTSGWRP